MGRHVELEAWIDTWRGPLVGLMASWGASFPDATELAQDTFAEAWLARERFEGDLADVEQVGAWLRGIGFNLFRNWRRARRAYDDVDDVDPATLEGEEDDRLQLLRWELERLPAKERAVLWMHYLEETGVRRVAALLRVTEKTVEGRLYRGRKLLRERMSQDLESPTGGRS